MRYVHTNWEWHSVVLSWSFQLFMINSRQLIIFFLFIQNINLTVWIQLCVYESEPTACLYRLLVYSDANPFKYKAGLRVGSAFFSPFSNRSTSESNIKVINIKSHFESMERISCLQVASFSTKWTSIFVKVDSFLKSLVYDKFNCIETSSHETAHSVSNLFKSEILHKL